MYGQLRNEKRGRGVTSGYLGMVLTDRKNWMYYELNCRKKNILQFRVCYPDLTPSSAQWHLSNECRQSVVSSEGLGNVTRCYLFMDDSILSYTGQMHKSYNKSKACVRMAQTAIQVWSVKWHYRFKPHKGKAFGAKMHLRPGNSKKTNAILMKTFRVKWLVFFQKRYLKCQEKVKDNIALKRF